MFQNVTRVFLFVKCCFYTKCNSNKKAWDFPTLLHINLILNNNQICFKKQIKSQNYLVLPKPPFLLPETSSDFVIPNLMKTPCKKLFPAGNDKTAPASLLS